MKRNLQLAAALLLVSVVSVLPAAAQSDPQTPAQLCEQAAAPEPATRAYSAPPENVLQPDTDYHAIFCTDAGAVYVDLYEDLTPKTVNNLVFLADSGYYNGTTFHRVIPDFMAQAGDPSGDGTGGPGYQFEDEIVPSLHFDGPGKLAMANAGPGTNGSQFFITTVPTPWLNTLHTIFGQVIDGQAIVEAIRVRDPATDTEPGALLKTILIVTDPTTVKLEAKPIPTQDEVVAALDQVDSIITADVSSVLENIKSNQLTPAVVAAAPDAVRNALEAYLTTHNHQYRVSSLLNNKACDLTTVQFVSVGYALDTYASPTDAAAAIHDAAAQEVAALQGWGAPQTSAALVQPFYVQKVTACDQPATRAITTWQRGLFVATVELTIPDSAGVSDADLGAILSDFVGGQIYEPLLSAILYSGIR